MIRRLRVFSRFLPALTIAAFTAGLPLNSAQAIGKGKGKGAGAVATVSYHCLGYASQQADTGSPYSYLANSIVLDAGGGAVTLEGAATGDLVVEGDTPAPNQMAGASITTDGLTMQPFDTCETTSGSVLKTVIKGVNLVDSTLSGAAYVEFHFNYHARLETQSTGDPEGDFSAYTETTLQVPGFEEQSFRVSAAGELIDYPPGLTVTDLSVDDHHVYEFAGAYTAEGQLYYGEDVTNVVQTEFQVGGEATNLDLDGSRIVAGFASAQALNTLTYEVISLDPNVLFSFVPEETAGNTGQAVATAEDATALASAAP